MDSRVKSWLIAPLCLVLGAATVPRACCSRGGSEFMDGEAETQALLGDQVAAAVREQRKLLFFETGNARSDGQASIAIYQMAVLGLGQIVLEHPELRERYLPAMRLATERLADPRTLSYAASRYGQHGVIGMGPREGHAYLGYINLALGMLRAVEPETRYAALHDRLTAELAARLFASKTGMIETYPGESWPPDVASVAGSIGLHATVTGKDQSPGLARWAERFRRCGVARTGYLIQKLAPGGCRPIDSPRGSGTAVASYFIGFAHPELSQDLYGALVQQGFRSLFGFGAFREYGPGHSGWGDDNSGPVLVGVSVGATGFGIGAARAHDDRDVFLGLYRSARLFGVWTPVDDRARFATGGLLGDALLLAMLTARRVDEK